MSRIQSTLGSVCDRIDQHGITVNVYFKDERARLIRENIAPERPVIFKNSVTYLEYLKGYLLAPNLSGADAVELYQYIVKTLHGELLGTFKSFAV